MLSTCHAVAFPYTCPELDALFGYAPEHDVERGGRYDARSAAINLWSYHQLNDAAREASETKEFPMRHQAKKQVQLAVAVALFVSIPPSRLLGGQTTSLSTPEQAVDFLRARRVLAEDLVIRVKGTAPNNIMAKRLYERARLYYNTYVDAVLSDILTGRKSDLSELAGQAGAAMEEFEKYVAKTIEQTTVDVAMKPDTLEFAAGAVGGIVSALIEGALKVWEYYSKQQESYREAVVKDLKRQIEWPAWDCIIRPDV